MSLVFRGFFIRVQVIEPSKRKKRTVDGVATFEEDPTNYVAAEIGKKNEEQPFTIGDGKMYGIYYNAPLDKDKEYQAFIGTFSRTGGVNIFRKNVFNETSHTQTQGH